MYSPNSPDTAHAGETDCVQLRENLNQLRKLETSGADPANAVAGMLHIYTGGAHPILRQRNQSNTGWINILDLTVPKLVVDADTLDGFHASELVPAANSISSSQLKTSTGSLSYHFTPGNYDSGQLVLPGGEYSFWPQLKATTGLTFNLKTWTASTSYVSGISLEAVDSTGWAYIQNRYVTASGSEYWIFLLVKKATGEVISSYEAADHPAYGNGGDPLKVPHPFRTQYLLAAPPDTLEIVLLDMPSTRSILAEAAGRSAAELIDSGLWKIDMAVEFSFAPRDMDGHSTLQSKDASYKVRRLVRQAEARI